MKERVKILAIFLVALAMVSTATGEIIYVDDDANGANDGSSWENAYNFLQDALADANSAVKPVEIRVAQGTYKPDQGVGITPGDRTATFQLINGITLKGGFAGFGEPNPDDRDIVACETILNGDLNGDDVEVADPCDLLTEPTRSENSYHIVAVTGTDETAVLDGFTIRGGNANNPSHWLESCGAGIYNDYGSLTITNCTFKANCSRGEGGGMYNNSGTPTLVNCTFNSNWASSGGGMCNIYSSPTLSDCTFSGNSALGGGGMVNGSSSPTLTNCTFSKNTADSGLSSNGGGMACYFSSPTLAICTFNENSAAHSGGGMFSHGVSSRLSNCTFSGNLAELEGGAMCNDQSNATLAECTFSQNSAGVRGGGVCNWYNNSTVVNCTFIENSVETLIYVYADGGGMLNMYANVTVTNCIFSGNSAKSIFGGDGGGINHRTDYEGRSLSITNCTFTGNTANYNGGGIYNIGGDATISNCILWGNRDMYGVGESAQIYKEYGGVYIVNCSCIQGWTGTFGGIGNIDADPCFAETGYWDENSTPEDANDDFWINGDYHLLPDSPCIDAGDPNYVAEPNDTDLDGKPRVLGEIIDMGAYEYVPPIPAEARIVPHALSLDSKGKWIAALLWIPEEYNITDIDPHSIFLESQIKPERFWVAEDQQAAIAKLSREDVQAVLDVGEVELTITGQLNDGSLFEAKDTIIVIDKAGKEKKDAIISKK